MPVDLLRNRPAVDVERVETRFEIGERRVAPGEGLGRVIRRAIQHWRSLEIAPVSEQLDKVCVRTLGVGNTGNQAQA